MKARFKGKLPMELSERLAGLEATVKQGFETARRDRDEAREQARRDLGEIKTLIQEHAEVDERNFNEHRKKISEHDDLISQATGFKKALAWLWAAIIAMLGILGYHLHSGK